MEGHITAREPDERITMLYTDKLMDVTVDAVVAPGRTVGSSSVTNTIDIRTKGVGKVFTPVIKRTLPKQTAADRPTAARRPLGGLSTSRRRKPEESGITGHRG